MTGGVDTQGFLFFLLAFLFSSLFLNFALLLLLANVDYSPGAGDRHYHAPPKLGLGEGTACSDWIG